MSALASVAEAFCATNGHRFVGHVGTGAFKETFHVVLATEETQALKVYQPGFSPERTSRELSAMQRCSHPNIGRLSAIATFYHDGIQYLLSLEEFLSGGTLTARLNRGLLSAEECQTIGRQLVNAVAHIASRDLVHRDIKPDNILFRADGTTPVLVDFGLVRDLVSTSLTQTWLLQGPGTPFFAPPEQLRNEKSMIDWRSDQFSLGTVLALGLFGFHPYQEDGASPQKTVECVGERTPQTRRFLEAAAQAGMSFLIRMTAPWPVQRFRTPDDLERACQEVAR
ncbi:serine/threonine-protein kinase [Paludibaculum fermentans]|uniref:Serine/threonine protein kinase n=1 Tax=Paludibaculum fermentans TaxID=1473598 RepID=A0A7S7NR44_PALFE|nr:serine/threonine-protein kinase [Paludibaculum fermentans]QOY88213.1 serine/threonine protein kinase [Paludibaculum fermentans]